MHETVFAIFGAVLGFLCSRMTNADIRRREFRAYINVLMVDVESLAPYEALQKYKTTVMEVRTRCAAVEEDVWLWKRDCFRDAWQRYTSDYARYEAGLARGKTLRLSDKAAGNEAKAEILRRLAELRRLAG